MGLFADMQRPAYRAASATTPPAWSNFWYDESGFLLDTTRVTSDRLLTIPPFWRGVKIYCDNLASFHWSVRERLERGSRPAPNLPEDYVLGHRPNPNNDAFQYWETVVLHVLIAKGHFSLKRYRPAQWRGRPVAMLELWPLHPDRVTPQRRPNGIIDFAVRMENGERRSFGPDEMFHVRGLSSDGLNALVLPHYARESAGNMLAAERFTKRFFDRGVTAALAAVSKDRLGPDQLDALRKSIHTYISGLENAYGVLTLSGDVTLTPIGVDPEKAQLHATREMTAVQACHWLNLPPGTLGDSKTPTFASSKQFRQDLVDISFRPLVTRIECAVNTQILALADEADPTRYFLRGNMDALLRGDATQRSENHERDIRAGWKTRNEARLIEDMEPIDGLDDPIQPLNMGSGTASSASRRMDRAALVTLQVATQLVRKEVAAATKAAQKFARDGAAWQDWLRDFYAGHAEEIAERLRIPAPVAREYASRQGLRLAERGIQAAADWEWTVAPELAELALSDHAPAA